MSYTLNASLTCLEWPDYTEQLCTAGEGYTGPYCGVCRPGFGATAPFYCQRCLGVGLTASGTSGHPSKIGISLVYIAYWLLFTGITLYSVWSAFSAQHKDDTQASTSSHKQPSPTSDVKAVRDQDRSDVKAVRDQDRSKGGTSPAQPLPTPSSPMDIIKVGQGLGFRVSSVKLKFRVEGLGTAMDQAPNPIVPRTSSRWVTLLHRLRDSSRRGACKASPPAGRVLGPPYIAYAVPYSMCAASASGAPKKPCILVSY